MKEIEHTTKKTTDLDATQRLCAVGDECGWGTRVLASGHLVLHGDPTVAPIGDNISDARSVDSGGDCVLLRWARLRNKFKTRKNIAIVRCDVECNYFELLCMHHTGVLIWGKMCSYRGASWGEMSNKNKYHRKKTQIFHARKKQFTPYKSEYS